jgi:hypothetical protein
MLWNLGESISDRQRSASETSKPRAVWVGHGVAATGAAVSYYLLLRLRNRDN